MKKIIVLGAGMVGKAMAIDLCTKYDVTSVDYNSESLTELKENHNIKTVFADLSKAEDIKNLVSDYDLVIGAVPGFMGFQTLKAVIEAGKNIVDISFFDEDPFLLNDLAKQNDVTAVMDFGVAPGTSNLILGYHNNRMKVENFECLVGGLPIVRSFPYEYKAPFSPIDVIEEYIRPSRTVENGSIVVKPALSEPEPIEFDGVGTLEAFNTDGLRTLLHMKNIPNLKEKTLRYPGHIKLMKAFRETGFFDKNPIEINGTSIRPLDFTTKLLFPLWKLKKSEEEFTIMRIIIEGKENGEHKKYVYQLLDKYDPDTKTSSMARTTGYPCTAMASLILENKYKNPGINPPEYVGVNEDCFNEIFDYLKERNIHYHLS